MGSTTGSIIITVKGKEVYVGTAPPSSPVDNELWLDISENNVLKYYKASTKTWCVVNDVSEKFGDVYKYLQTNYYTKTETNSAVKEEIGKTTIIKKDGTVVNMKDAINSVIDTATEHTQKIEDINSKYNSVTGEITEVKTSTSEIKQDLNGFKTTVSENYVDKTKFNNLQIGGRNILLNSKFNLNADKWMVQGNVILEYVVKYGRKCVHINHSGLETKKCVTQSVLGKLEPDTVYTMSGWVLTENIVKGTTNYFCAFYHDGFYLKDGTSTWYGYGLKPLPINAGKWIHLEWTFTTDSEKLKNATSSRIYVFTRDLTGDIYFSDLKLEKGNKATDWSPAPEDIETEITSVETIATQTANKFNWLVKSGTSATDFTLTDRTATLVSDYINLKGLVTFSGLNSDAQNKINTANTTANSANTKAQGIIDNIYTKNTTTIDGGKITTNSIKAKQIDVTNLFAQDITASGTITGAKLYGTYIEANSGEIGGWDVTSDKLFKNTEKQYADYIGDYISFGELGTDGWAQTYFGAGIWITAKSSYFRQGYRIIDEYDDDGNPIKYTEHIGFEANIFGIRTDDLVTNSVSSDLISKPIGAPEPLPGGYNNIYYNIGIDTLPWEKLYVREINVVKNEVLGTGGNISAQGDIISDGDIISEGDIIAGVGTSNQVSLIGLKGLKNDLMGDGSNYFTFDSYGSEMTLPASKNTLMGAFSVKKSGWYLFKPEYRFVSLPTGRVVSVRVFEYTNVQYPVKNFQGSVTLVGAGVDFVCMNGIQIFQAKANTKYYIYGYSAGGTATCDALGWYNVYCLKTT